MKSERSEKDTLRRAAEARLGDLPPVAERSPQALLQELQIHQIELEMQNEALRLAHTAMEESRDRYAKLFDSAPVGYVTLSGDDVVVEANLFAAELFGIARSGLNERRFVDLVAPRDHDRWRRFVADARRDGIARARNIEVLLKAPGGAPFPAQLQCAVDLDAAVPTMRIAFADVTERKRAEEEQRIAAIAFESQEGMIVADDQGVIIRVNKAFTSLTGYSMGEAVGRTPAMLSSGRHDRAFYQLMWQTLKEKLYWQGEVWNRRADGTIYVAWLTISAVVAPDGRISHYVGAFSDTTELNAATAEINRLAHIDPLTNLPNRRMLQDRLAHALAASSRSGLCGAVLFLDLDGFKALNDTHGHDVGDLLLIKVAQRLRNSLREGDTVARLGGDEFVMILEGLGAQRQDAAVLAKHIGEKLTETIAHVFDLGDSEFQCTTSIGARVFSPQDSVKDLLKHADLALYRAKAAGRNTVRFYDESMQAALDERGLLEDALRLAIKEEQFELYFQPQIDSTRRVIGAEALLRWHHPQLGLIAPSDFLELAEQTELTLPIGRWVLETACRQLNAWSRASETCQLRLAVNVSPRQVRQRDFVDLIRNVLDTSGANPARLTLELTQGPMLDSSAELIQKMKAIRQWGVHFAINNFGTGASFSYLTRLLLDQLKLDMSFLEEQERGAVIMNAITAMAEGLGVSIIAERVETEVQRAFLARHGCHVYQGHLFSQPLPLEGFERFVRALA